MIIRRVLAAVAGAGVLLLGATTMAAAGSQEHGTQQGQLSKLRAATTKFHNIATAEQNGYGLLADLQGIVCIDMPGMGAMGIHWANTDLVGDPAVIPTQPEAMVYRPGKDGVLHLAAVEYVTIKDAWDATHKHAPRLFGHRFNFTDAPNRYGLPPFYSLHVWAFEHNPAGTFQMWNPQVHCPAQQPTMSHAGMH